MFICKSCMGSGLLWSKVLQGEYQLLPTTENVRRIGTWRNTFISMVTIFGWNDKNLSGSSSMTNTANLRSIRFTGLLWKYHIGGKLYKLRKLLITFNYAALKSTKIYPAPCWSPVLLSWELKKVDKSLRFPRKLLECKWRLFIVVIIISLLPLPLWTRMEKFAKIAFFVWCSRCY